MNSSAARWKCPTPCATHASGIMSGRQQATWPVSSRCRKSASCPRIARQFSTGNAPADVSPQSMRVLAVEVFFHFVQLKDSCDELQNISNSSDLGMEGIKANMQLLAGVCSGFKEFYHFLEALVS